MLNDTPTKICELIVQLGWYLEALELEQLGLTPDEIIGALEVMCDNADQAYFIRESN